MITCTRVPQYVQTELFTKFGDRCYNISLSYGAERQTDRQSVPPYPRPTPCAWIILVAILQCHEPITDMR